jgi:ABC-type proline/glycine betaine transport system permease subunit
MAKQNWKYWMTVGFHLAIVSIPAMIVAWVIGIPLGMLLGGAAPATLLMLAEMLIGFLIFGYFVVRFKKWIFQKKIL